MKRCARYAGLLGSVFVVVMVGVGGSRAAPTLTTITVDGNIADWAAVLADTDNVVLDGPAGGLSDADARAPSNLNVDRVAFTWDATYVYFYVRRLASAPEFNYFYFHFDLDNDGLVADNSPLLRVGWWGNNRRTDTSLDRYRAVSLAGGDPIAGAGGSHDGYKLPGTRLAGPAIESLTGGTASGLEMEVRVPWAVLGVAPGSALQFHLSTTRRLNEYPAQIRDNLGRGTAYAGVIVAPDRSATATPGTTVVLAHTVTNAGNVTDRFDLTWTSSGDFAPTAVVLYRDADGTGTLTPGDLPLGDSDGDGTVDTGPLALGRSLAVLAVVSVPASAAFGDAGTVMLRAVSSYQSGIADTAVETIAIAQPALTLLKAADRASAPPASVITYTITFTNTGTADAHAVRVEDPVPAFTTYVAGSAAGPGATIAFSHDGGASFDASEAAPVTHVRWDLPAALPPGGSGSISFQVFVD